jgi:hypothetical protein
VKTNVRRFVRDEWPNLLFWSLFGSMFLLAVIVGLTAPSTTGPGR